MRKTLVLRPFDDAPSEDLPYTNSNDINLLLFDHGKSNPDCPLSITMSACLTAEYISVYDTPVYPTGYKESYFYLHAMDVYSIPELTIYAHGVAKELVIIEGND